MIKRRMKQMKPKLIFILSLTFLFLYPSISLSQTFKCEFIQEKFKGGKTNEGTCTGDPEILFSHKSYVSPRNKHCEVDEKVFSYEDYTNYIVDLENKKITFTSRKGVLVKGSQVQETTGIENDILNIYPFTQIKNNGEIDGKSKTTSYLVTYKSPFPDFMKNILIDEYFHTLYIPQHGKSIISSYYNNISQPDRKGDSSFINMRFGKCVNTSN
jgi:hypothetical protein